MGIISFAGKTLALFDLITVIIFLLMQFGHKIKSLLFIASIYLIVTGFLDRFSPDGGSISLKIIFGIYGLFAIFVADIYFFNILSILYLYLY